MTINDRSLIRIYLILTPRLKGLLQVISNYFHFKNGLSDSKAYPLNLYENNNVKDIAVFYQTNVEFC